MKTKLFTACMLALSIAACKKEIKLEVKQIKETGQTAEWNISVNRPAFSTTETEVEKSCVKYNDEITGLVKTNRTLRIVHYRFSFSGRRKLYQCIGIFI